MANSEENNASILVYVPAAVKHAVRIAAAMENTGMSAYIAGLVTKDLAAKKLL
jgi:ethanolamine utilization protein EutP (predicted NTPase)